MRVLYRKQALADIDDIVRHVRKESNNGAHNVSDAIYASIRVIAHYPYGCERADNSDIRVKIVPRYRYKIFYKIIDIETVRIIHVRHTSRRPWKLQ